MPSTRPEPGALAQAVRSARARWRWFATSLLCLLAARAVGLSLPVLGGALTARLAGGSGVVWLAGASVAAITGAAVVLMAAAEALRFASAAASLRGGEWVIADLRAALYARIQSLRAGELEHTRAGEVAAMFGHEAETVAYFVSDVAVRALPTALAVMAGAALMSWLDPVLGAATCGLAVAVLVVNRLGSRRVRGLTRALNAEQAAMAGLLCENIAVLPAIKIFGREPHEQARYGAGLERVRRAMLAQQHAYLGASSAASVLAGAACVALVGVGAHRVTTGALAGPALVSFVLYAVVLVRPLGELAGLHAAYRQALGAADRLGAITEPEPERAPEVGLGLPDGPRRFELRDVWFAYPGRSPVLRGVDLVLEPGECVAVLGEIGAGKTTLARLLMRLRAPARGALLLDEVDLQALRADQLRASIGFVGQHDYLVHGSVRDNVAYGAPGAADAALRRAAELAGAAAFIEALPDGYDTAIGERGVALSGGQRQRLALARAFARDPRLLILDEATAMFDPASELELLRSATPWLRERAVLLVTHRPALLALADRFVTLIDGRLREARQPATEREAHA